MLILRFSFLIGLFIFKGSSSSRLSQSELPTFVDEPTGSEHDNYPQHNLASQDINGRYTNIIPTVLSHGQMARVNVIRAHDRSYNDVFNVINDVTIESHLPPGSIEEGQQFIRPNAGFYYDRLAQEEEQTNDPYHMFEWKYAQSVAHPDLAQES